MNPYKVVEQFEEEIAKYCGSPFAVACDSATNALTMCCDYMEVDTVFIPKHTYVSVPQSIINAGGKVKFTQDYEWQKDGYYKLAPYRIYDSARLLTSDMYKMFDDSLVCLSLHWGKTLNLGQGGVILCSNDRAADGFKKHRWDGRTAGVAPKDDEITFVGRHCPMSPRDAADALTRLSFLPKHNEPLPPEPNYPDLSKVNWNDLR